MIKRRIILSIIMVTMMQGGVKNLLLRFPRNMYQQPLWTTMMMGGALGAALCYKRAKNAYLHMLQTLNMDIHTNHSYEAVFNQMGKLSEHETRALIRTGINELGFLLFLAISISGATGGTADYRP